MIELFTREEIWAMQNKAEKNLDAVTNINWKMAYENFIFACTVLDAFIARSSVPVSTCNCGVDYSNMPEAGEPCCANGVNKPMD